MTSPLALSLEIMNPMGLHARPSAKLAELANRFACDIAVELGGERVNAKSILDLMTLAAECGQTLDFTLEGEDQNEASEAIIALVVGGFDEMGE